MYVCVRMDSVCMCVRFVCVLICCIACSVDYVRLINSRLAEVDEGAERTLKGDEVM